MNVDYYAVLAKAVAGKDAAARDKIYKDAYGLIRKSSHLTREDALSHAAALEEAIRQIERQLAAEEARSAADIDEVLSPDRNWKPLVFGGSAVIAVLVACVLLYGYVATKGPGVASVGVTASSSKPQHRAKEDVVMPDLKPGEDGGSSGEILPFALQRQVVFYRTTVVPGSIVVDRENRFLYLIDGNNSARRYGVGIAQECLKGGSFFRVTNKLEWPDWRTSSNTKDAEALLAATGRPGSLLGARALLLDKPGLLIHGTNSPKTIGHLVASGCIRLVNDDVEDLYRRVSLETRVVFIS
jgi:lipoprotein-anchoring transpeptidase ErfK/SrfK